jgi:hypothetical protein
MSENRHPVEWSEQDVADLRWHDCHVHGVRLRNPYDAYDYDLVLDIDYILEWIKIPGGQFSFVVAPARLSFKNVDKLAVDLGLVYKEDLVIDAIDWQDTSSHPELGVKEFQSAIHFQSLSGRCNEMRFRCRGFLLRLTSEPTRTGSQSLDGDTR